jgi:hypothetical protein
MDSELAIERYCRWYRKLLRCYPKAHRQRFGESMEQTFNDLCRERASARPRLLGFVLWLLIETAAGILRENGRYFVIRSREFVRVAMGVGLAKFLRIVLPVAFFAAAVAAWVQMQNAVAVNIVTGVDNQLRHLFFRPLLPTHAYVADVWLWTSVACILCGVIAVGRLLRAAKLDLRGK